MAGDHGHGGKRRQRAEEPAQQPALQLAPDHGPAQADGPEAMLRALSQHGLHARSSVPAPTAGPRSSSSASSTATTCGRTRATTASASTGPTRLAGGLEAGGRVRERARPEVHRLRVVPRPVRRQGRSGSSSPTASTRPASSRRSQGLQFFYHNHDFEFVNQFDGAPAYDILLDETDRAVRQVRARPATGSSTAARDAVQYLAADPARFPLYHVKDHTWRDRADARTDWEDVGPGSIDFPDIFDAGRRAPARQALRHRARLAAALAPGRRAGRAARPPTRACEYLEERALVARVPDATCARKSSCRRVSPAISGWKEITSTLPWRTATG